MCALIRRDAFVFVLCVTTISTGAKTKRQLLRELAKNVLENNRKLLSFSFFLLFTDIPADVFYVYLRCLYNNYKLRGVDAECCFLHDEGMRLITPLSLVSSHFLADVCVFFSFPLPLLTIIIIGLLKPVVVQLSLGKVLTRLNQQKRKKKCHQDGVH